ncbi:YIP1 family protein [bacterium]|nr:YIP1 family protein [bacterium]
MNFFHRFLGIFFNPEPTFQALSKKPFWVDALILILIASAIFSYIQAPYSKQDTLRLMKNNVQLKEKLGEERFNQMLDRVKDTSPPTLFLRSFLLSPLSALMGFLLSSLILMGLGRFISGEGHYVQVFSAYVHAHFVDKILGNAVRLFLIISQKSALSVTTSVALFFPQMEITSPLFVVLSQVDFFQLWLFGILGFGLSWVFQVHIRKALFLSYGFWLLQSLFFIALGLLSSQFFT